MAARGELERIGDKVLQHLADLVGVAADLQRRALLDLDAELQLLLVELRLHQVAHVLQQLAQVDLLAVHLELACLDLRQIKDVVDQLLQIVAGLVDHPRLLLLLALQAGLFGRQQLGQQQDGIERGAQLVADVGQKLGLVAVALFQLAGVRAQVAGLRGMSARELAQVG